jgi:hypothetical protein
MAWLWDRLGVDKDRLPKGWQANDEWTAAAAIVAAYYGYNYFADPTSAAGAAGATTGEAAAASAGGSFLGNLGTAAATGFVNSAAASLGQGVAGGLTNNIFEGDKNIYDQDEVLEQLTHGNQLDLNNQKEMFDYRINQGINAGMTPYEMFMGPAAGAGGGTTGSGNTLGNAAKDKMLQQEKLNNQNMAQASMQAMQQQTALQQTKMQTDAQIEVANIQAGVTREGHDNQYAIAVLQDQLGHRQLNLKQKELNNVTIPLAAAQLKLNKQQVLKAINEVKTSDPRYQKLIKLMTMSPDNATNLLINSRFGVDISDPKVVANLTEREVKNMIGVYLAAGSSVNREIQGLLGLDPFNEGIFDISPIGSLQSDADGLIPKSLGKKRRENRGAERY